MSQLFRYTGWLEGISFLGLLGIAMPLKYAYGMPEAVSVVGMAHGVLFMVYVALAFGLSDQENWPRRKLGYAVLASVLPLGTFVFDRKFLAHLPEKAN